MRQRGQAQLYIIGGVAIVMLLMLAAIHYYKSRYEVVEAQFESFKDKTAALGEQAKAHKIEQETANATKIQSALSERDAALKRLSSFNASRSLLPGAAAGSKDPDRICFERKGIDAAIQRFRVGVQGLIVEGDKAIIDDKAWLASWPKPITAPKPSP